MSAIDLCQLSDVRNHLALPPGQVQTTIAAGIVAGVQTVTPASMANITVQSILGIDSGASAETVTVTSVTGTTFTATFALGHSATPISVVDQTDAILSRMITAASAYWLWRTGRGNADGSIPSQSPLVQPVSYNEWYDGNGSSRMFVRNTPITALSSLAINGVLQSVSSGPTVPGYVIDQSGKSLVIRSRGCFARGVQNVNVQYTAGFSATPFDISDACIEMVAVNFRRRGWIDQKSIVMPEGQGVISYRDWELPPKVVSVMRNYTRLAIV